MPTAIIYGRVSTVRQADDGLPIESQVQQAKAKAEALGAKVLQIFLDEGISGRSSKRPAFQGAVNFCSLTKVDYFICWSTSRFARNKIDAASYKRTLKRWGGSCGAGFQIESATGRSALYHYYNCRSAQKGKGCINRRIPAHELDSWLTDKILDRLFTHDRMAELVKEVRELKGDQERARLQKLESLESELRIVERKQNKIFELMETHGRDTPNLGDLTRRLRAHKSQIDALEKGIMVLETQTATQITVSEGEVREATNLFRGMIKDGSDPKKIRLFFSSFVKQISVYDDHVRCDYNPERLVQRTGYDSIPLIDKGSNQWLPDEGLLRTASITLKLPEKLCRRAA